MTSFMDDPLRRFAILFPQMFYHYYYGSYSEVWNLFPIVGVQGSFLNSLIFDASNAAILEIKMKTTKTAQNTERFTD
jgi:hypothetical protein